MTNVTSLMGRILIAGALALAVVPARAQDGSAANGQPQADNAPVIYNLLNKKANNADLFSFDYGIPDSPALSLAGLSGESLTPSTSLKPFVLSLPGVLGGDSSQTSAALDTAPAWLFHSEGSVSLDEYAHQPWTQLAFRSRLGVALYKGDDGGGDASKEKPSRAAFGFNTSFFEDSDPILAKVHGHGDTAWNECLKDNQIPVFDRYADEKSTKLAIDDSNSVGFYLRYLGSHPTATTLPTGANIVPLAEIEQDIGTVVSADKLADRAKMNLPDRVAADRTDIDDYKSQPSAALTAADTAAEKVLTTCRQQASDAAQHGLDLELGAGLVWSGDPGKWANFGHPNEAAWLAGRLPLAALGDNHPCEAKDDVVPPGQDSNSYVRERSELACWMIGMTGRYSAGEMVSTGDATTPLFRADVAEGWVGLERIDSNSKFGGYFGYMSQRATDGVERAFSKSGTRWLVSGAYSLGFIQDGLWIQGSYGAANGSVSTLNDKVALLSLTFGPPKIGSGFINSSADSTSGSGSK